MTGYIQIRNFPNHLTALFTTCRVTNVALLCRVCILQASRAHLSTYLLGNPVIYKMVKRTVPQLPVFYLMTS